MSLSFPPSHCPNCNYQLRWYDNIPLLSYIFLGGKCRNCKQPISFRYFFVELLNLLLALIAFFLYFRENPVLAVAVMCIFSVLICIAFIDLDFGVIPDRLQLLLLLFVIVYSVRDNSLGLYDRFFAVIVISLALALVYILCFLALKREPFGIGDLKLIAIAAFAIGIASSVFLLIIASVSAALVLLVSISRCPNDKHKEFPFAPFLAAAFAFSLLCGEFFVSWYFDLLS